METNATCLSPGVYQYSYSTFVDVPQYISVHFLTPDHQLAFVSYPHRHYKAAQLIPVSWFKSVELVAIDSQPQLLPFIEFLVTGLVNGISRNVPLRKVTLDEGNAHLFQEQLAA